ncbi:MAG: two-component system sensor histidine kinase NtrB [Tuberibacillus sp.]
MEQIRPLISSLDDIGILDDELSFEVRYMIGKNGKILKTNRNGKQLLQKSSNFMEILLPSEREKANSFISFLEDGVLRETRFHHRSETGIDAFRYRGKKIGSDFLLTGIKVTEKDPHVHTYFNGLYDKMFQIAEIGLLVLNSNNEVVYKNDAWILTENRLSNVGDFPLVKKAVELADTVRSSKEIVQRYHVNDNRLYRLHGLYNVAHDYVIFLFDDRETSADYDQLLKTKTQMESVSYLAAGFAHELRNPLSIIRGYIQLSGLTNSLKKYYGTILSEIERMNRIIEDFLSLSRKAANKVECEPHMFFMSVIDLIRSECLLKNIELEYSFERSTKHTNIDQSMIIQVMLNLFRNAIEAFPKEQLVKRFSINGMAHDECYQVMVWDNGPGMEESVLNQVGNPFFTTKENGTGIGLPLSKKIIQDHGGNFSIESRVGMGTLITMEIPYCDSSKG